VLELRQHHRLRLIASRFRCPGRRAAAPWRYPVVVGGDTPYLPPVTDEVPLELIETRTFGSRVIYERCRLAAQWTG
jgi:hypothetical protein